jgi:hemerythrin superfamily protein
MNAIDLLKQQHREVEALFEKLEKSKEQAGKLPIFRELASKLVGHDGIEREIFYPACEEALGMNDELGEALVEHGVVEFCLYQADQAIGQEDFDFKVNVLQELLQHHIEEEESEFFPKVQKALGHDSLDLLGEEMRDAFEEALDEDYHDALFENLRQVLIGSLKPSLPDEAEEAGMAEKPRARRSGKRKSA